MQMPVYGCEDPTGYSDKAVDWMDPGVLAVRWQFAYDLYWNRIPGVTVQGSPFFDDMRQSPEVWEFLMVERVFANETPGALTLAPFRKRVKKTAKDYPPHASPGAREGVQGPRDPASRLARVPAPVETRGDQP